jgi:hypothetical protein
MAMLNGDSFFGTIKPGRLTVFKASVNDSNDTIEAKDFIGCPMQDIIPGQSHEFLPLFRQILADNLPPHRLGIEHKVCLKEGDTSSWGPLYSMSRAELVVLKDQLEENMSKGFICQ